MHTKYTGSRETDFNVYAQAVPQRRPRALGGGALPRPVAVLCGAVAAGLSFWLPIIPIDTVKVRQQTANSQASNGAMEIAKQIDGMSKLMVYKAMVEEVTSNKRKEVRSIDAIETWKNPSRVRCRAEEL